MRLEEGRQDERLSERRGVLVNRESWTVGRDLEQYAVWLAHVQAPEPEAVHLAAVRNVELVQSFCPRVVVRIGRAERDMVNASCTLPRNRQVWLHRDVQLRMRTCSSHFEYVHTRAGIIGMRAVAHQTHIEDARQQRIRRVQRGNADDDRAEATNLVFLWH